jgi:hypothetical protein
MVKRNAALLDNLVLLLPPYILAILAGISVWFLQKNVTPSDSYLVYERYVWCARALLAAFSIWLLAPPVYGRSIPTGVTDVRRRVVAVAILLASSWLCLAVPMFVERLAEVRLQGATSTENLRSFFRLYIPAKLFAFDDFPNDMKYLQSFLRGGPEKRGRFWSEAYGFAGEGPPRSRQYSLLGPTLPEDLASLPSRYCSVANGLRLRVHGELIDVDECTQYLAAAVSRVGKEGSWVSGWSPGIDLSMSPVMEVHSSIEWTLGTLFVANHLGSLKARPELPCAWLWTVALAVFWTAAVQFGGDLARKGIFAGLIPFWLAELGHVTTSMYSFRLSYETSCALSLMLIAIYIYVYGPRRYFPAFRWIQFLTAVGSGVVTVVFFELLQPPTLIETAENEWYFTANMVGAFFALAMFVAVELFRLRSASWAVAPIRSKD